MHQVTPGTISADGVTISFRESGDPAGPAAVLLHGGSSSAATWHHVAAALTAAGYRVIAADLRGHGGSSRARDYPLAGYADDIRGLMDTLGIASAALVGHSLGGYAASVFAQLEPSRVTRLVLEEPGMPARDADGRRGLSGPRFLLPALAGLAARRGFDRKAVTSAVRQLRVPDPQWWDRLALITAPTLLVSGGPASHIAPGSSRSRRATGCTAAARNGSSPWSSPSWPSAQRKAWAPENPLWPLSGSAEVEALRLGSQGPSRGHGNGHVGIDDLETRAGKVHRPGSAQQHAEMHRCRVLGDVEDIGRLRPGGSPRSGRSSMLSSTLV
jgi:pimeloyl-ACP methyl ester carboxylesterase